jgi:hypothetical protein
MKKVRDDEEVIASFCKLLQKCISILHENGSSLNYDEITFELHCSRSTVRKMRLGKMMNVGHYIKCLFLYMREYHLVCDFVALLMMLGRAAERGEHLVLGTTPPGMELSPGYKIFIRKL